ncbi:extensin family protein [Magnetospirillum sulfuroxidans]|uniref:Extensin family protein n=1 Tax=Magnetospirillum sulfuroxidans TaxID=611300 RepID=A0ABS5ID42_9PROT|nr:extensin family protein [Magnetospirillum sulfuroxidans]MBR9972341.1 extensin family protein [Magnetospirillum sulfuroxidans]
MLRRLALLVVVAGLAACAQPPARIVAQAPPPLLDPDSVCLASLQAMRVQFQPVAEFGDTEQGCGIDNPVKVSATGGAWSRPGVVSCPMAQTISRYESDVLQPAARARFGQGIKRIHHAGTYDCRVRRTSTKVAASLGGSRGGRLSEHSKGRAIDIMAFELDDGTMVSVKKDWRGQGAKSAFLQEVARASCSVFNVALTPNHDRLHSDHLHLDIGPYTLCGY